jgi:citrate synthase
MTEELSSRKTAALRRRESVPARIVAHRRRPRRLLDYGCGRSRDVEYFRSLGIEAMGYDPFHAPIDLGPLAASFDLVMCTYVLGTLPPESRSAALAGVRRLLCPGGRLVVSVRDRIEVERERRASWLPEADGWRTHRGTFQKGFTRAEVLELLSQAGFTRPLVLRDHHGITVEAVLGPAGLTIEGAPATVGLHAAAGEEGDALMSASSRSPAVANGLEGIIASETRLSHVDGQAGELIIGGYALEELAGRASIEEVAWLLWHGRLPEAGELSELRATLAARRNLPSAVVRLLAEAVLVPPMDALRMGAAVLSLDDPDPSDESREAMLRRAATLVARFPVLVATHQRLRKGESLLDPRPQLGSAANFLYLMTGEEPSEAAAKALETYWVTVVDHGMNASTFTARVIASTRSDVYSAVTGAIGALKGPLHGGAPGPVLDMLLDIKSVDRADQWVRNELAEGRRLMGFGHRIYKVRDPRADVLSEASRALSENLGDRSFYDLATQVEEVVLRVLEEVKPGRGLKTNVEFYTALVLQSIGLTPDLFSPMFACGRVVGWIAHVLEQQSAGRLIRPQSLYTGPRGLKYIPPGQR